MAVRKNRFEGKSTQEICDMFPDVAEAYAKVDGVLNSMTKERRLALVELLAREHPTLQANATSFAFELLERMALKQPHAIDPRNEYAIEQARKALKAVDGRTECYSC